MTVNYHVITKPFSSRAPAREGGTTIFQTDDVEEAEKAVQLARSLGQIAAWVETFKGDVHVFWRVDFAVQREGGSSIPHDTAPPAVRHFLRRIPDFVQSMRSGRREWGRLFLERNEIHPDGKVVSRRVATVITPKAWCGGVR